jgi:pimeloyl-ACP methyl ester carboxylesterase
MKIVKRTAMIVAALLLVAVLGFVLWGSSAAQPMPEALQALESDQVVEVIQDNWIYFKPASGNISTGLILYPGGRVDPRAYAPAARDIANSGYPVFIIPMPLNLAVLAPDRAASVIATFPTIDQWVIGGHSLGGAMAARFAYQNPDLTDGLLLWASYPADSNDLSNFDLHVTSIYGTRDGLASTQEISLSMANLPPDTNYFPLEGGNHAQFGWYGAQNGDLEATISREEQQSAIVEASLELLDEVASNE